ncbi:histidine kinase [Flavilitoribacter nigricans]|nr:histidine kinase [Flavilitoribacter nigricans]
MKPLRVKYLFIGTIALLKAIAGFSQSIPSFQIGTQQSQLYVSPVSVRVDSTNTATLEEVLTSDFLPQDQLVVHHFIKPFYTYWSKFTVKNTSADTVEAFLGFNEFDKLALFAIHPHLTAAPQRGGVLTNDRNKEWNNPMLFPITLVPKDSVLFVARSQDLASIVFAADTLDFSVEVYSKSSLYVKLQEEHTGQLRYYTFTIAFLAIVIFMTFFTLIKWRYNQDYAYLYYSGYTFALFLYFLRELEINYYGINFVFSYLTDWYYFVEIATSMFMYSMYALFIQYFLDVKKVNPTWYRRAILGSKVMGIFTLLSLVVLLVFGNQIVTIASLVFRIFLAFLALLYILHLFRTARESILIKIVLGGTMILIFANLVGLGIEHFGLSPAAESNSVFKEPLIYPQLGVLLDLLIFFIGLAYKENLLRKDKMASERAALAARMRPHFISNGLNSIKLLIQEEKNRRAVSYLTKFARLLREIIEFSVKDQITLRQELEWAKTYLEIEHLRFSGEFESEISVDNTIDTNQVLIPPLVLQPHLENAITHGLRSVEELEWQRLAVPRTKKKLDILITRIADGIKCVVEDNGVGRAMTSSLKENSTKNESIGIKTTAARLAQFEIQQIIIDRVDKGGNPLGTTVEIILPSKNK